MDKAEFIIELQVLQGLVAGLLTEIRFNTIGQQGTADKLTSVSDKAHELSELAQNGEVDL